MAVASIISLRVPPFPLFQSSSECMLNVDKSVFRCNFIDKIWKRTEFDGQNLFSVLCNFIDKKAGTEDKF